MTSHDMTAFVSSRRVWTPSRRAHIVDSTTIMNPYAGAFGDRYGAPRGVVFVYSADAAHAHAMTFLGPRGRRSLPVSMSASDTFDVVRSTIWGKLGIHPDRQQFDLVFWGQERRPVRKNFRVGPNDCAVPISGWAIIGPQLRPGWRIDCEVQDLGPPPPKRRRLRRKQPPPA